MRRLVSENPMPVMDGSSSPNLSVVQADTECAETLLALAASWQGTADCKSKMETPHFDEETINEAIARQNEEDQYHAEILKRVKLDHNYYWSGPLEHRPAVTPASKVRKISENDSLKHEKDSFVESDFMSSPEYSPDSGVSDLSPDQPVCSKRSDCNELNSVSYSNLQILLQCIVDSEKMELGDGQNDEEGVDSDSGTPSGNMMNRSSVESMGSSSNQHYVCHKCSRQFTKKRYLTKHVRRMHPEMLGVKNQHSTCPSCGNEQTKRNLSKNYVMCMQCLKKNRNKTTETDVATCQHCGVRLRRHILVKHLAREHCVDRAGDLLDDLDSGLFTCHICNAQLHRNQVTDHFLDKHLCKDADKGLHLDCQLCGMELTETSLTSHLINEHCQQQSIDSSPVTKASLHRKSPSVPRAEFFSKFDDDSCSPVSDEDDSHFAVPSYKLHQHSVSKVGGDVVLSPSLPVAAGVSPSKEGRTNRHFIVKKAEASGMKVSLEEKHTIRHTINAAPPGINKNALLIQPLSY